jgi:hypothetical protein
VKIYWMFVVMLMVAVGLTACGGGDSSSSSKLMGGAIQGKALSLANTGSTVAGSTVTHGNSSDANFANPDGVVKNGANLFVADRENHTIRKVDIATGAVTTIAGTAGVSGSADGTGAAANFNYPSGITTDGTNLFVADWANCTIRKIVIATGVVTTIAGTAGVSGSVDGAGAAARFRLPHGITTDNVNLFVSDTGNSTIRQVVISSGAVTTLAGKAHFLARTDGTGDAARFNDPSGVIVAGPNLFVADPGNRAIRKVDIATGAVTTFAGTAGTSGSSDGTGTAASFQHLSGITTDGANLFVTDNNAIRKIVIATSEVSTIAGMADAPGSFADGTGTAARFNEPSGVTTDGTDLFVADMGNYTIRKLVISTGGVTTIAGTTGVSGIVETVAVSGSADGTGAAATFNGPAGVTTDGANLYVAEGLNFTIRKIVISTGVVTTIAGTAGVSGSTDGTGAAASFYFPYGITTDGANLFVTDAGSQTIRKIVIATGVVTTIAGTADVTGSTDGTGAAASFYFPAGITTDGANIFVVDSGNCTIRKIVIATGVVTTIAGTAGVSGSTDGTGVAASFYEPYGITTDGTNLFVTDPNNYIIRKIVISTGEVTTIAGTARVSGTNDGTGTAARFNGMSGITTDGTNLFVVDPDTNSIRRIVISTGVVTTIDVKATLLGSTDGAVIPLRNASPEGITTDGASLFVTDFFNSIIRRIR